MAARMLEKNWNKKRWYDLYICLQRCNVNAVRTKMVLNMQEYWFLKPGLHLTLFMPKNIPITYKYSVLPTEYYFCQDGKENWDGI